MKRWLVLLALAASGLAVAVPNADAHGWRSRTHVGVVIGAPLWWHWGPWPHYPAYERVIVERPGPTVYVEKDPDGVERNADEYWYFCPDSETYYPYVKKCATPWQRVVPHSPPQ